MIWFSTSTWSCPDVSRCGNKRIKDYWHSYQKRIFTGGNSHRTHKKTSLSWIRDTPPSSLTPSNGWSISWRLLSPGFPSARSDDDTKHRANTRGLQEMSHNYLDAVPQHDTRYRSSYPLRRYELRTKNTNASQRFRLEICSPKHFNRIHPAKYRYNRIKL